jgi:peptide/nickel transport system substrate-binding protein
MSTNTTAFDGRERRDGWQHGWLGWLLGALFLVTVTAACGGGDDGDEDAGDDASVDTTETTVARDPEPGGELVFALTGETDSWNPAAGTWSPSAFNVARAIYDPITVIDLEGVAQPYLVDSIESNDTLTEWIIKLRDDDITFHNGDPFDAEVLATHLKTMQLAPLTSFAFDPVDAVAVLEPDHESCGAANGCVIVFTNEPWGTFPAMLSGQAGYLVHPGMHEGTVEDPTGTGPFVFEEWAVDDHLTVVRNDSYWRPGMPYLDKVTFTPMSDSASRESSLKAGDIDLYHSNDAARLLEVGHDGSGVDEGFQVVFDSSSGDEMHIILDTQSGPTADPEVRRALALATDRAGLNDGLYDGFFELADGPYREDEFWWGESGWPEPDPDQAAAIVEEWEAENGDLVLDYAVVLGTEPLSLAQAVQEQWEAVGIGVDIQQLDQSAFAQVMLLGESDAMQIAYYNRSDPDEMFHFWDPDRIGEPGELSLNFPRYTSDVQGEALHAARATDDPDERKAQYTQVWADWAENFPYLWLYHVEWMLVGDDDIENLGTFTFPNGEPAAPMDWGAVFLTDVWIDA